VGKQETLTSSFKPGELKTISDTIVLRTSDVKRIAAGLVSIAK